MSETFAKNHYKLFLILLFVLALFLRWMYLSSGGISFAYDQARDAFLVQEMIAGNLKILGPPVSGVPGLFHGVLYYYIIAPFYFLGNGSPIFVAYVMSFISSLGIIGVFYLTFLLTKRYTPSVISALLFTVSFEASQYANLLTNASMGLWFAPYIYIFLYIWITERKSKILLFKFAPFLTGFFLGLSIQSELALGYHLLPVIFWIILYRKNITKKDIFNLIFGTLVTTSTMWLAEIKFGFPAVKGFWYLFSGQDKIASSRNLFDLILIFSKQVSDTFSYNLFPASLFLGAFLGFGAVFYTLANYKTKSSVSPAWHYFLTTYIFAHFFALPFGGTNMRHVMVGAASGICVFMGVFIWKYLWNRKILAYTLLLIVVASNIAAIVKENKNGQTIFPLQLDLVLSKEIEAVDYTYIESGGNEFSISTLTSPLFVNTLWSYLYNWHGLNRYGYLPSWVGRDQIGQLGNSLVFASGKAPTHFFIIEPTYGIPRLYVNYAYGDQDAITTVSEEVNFGEITVQKRLPKNEQI